MLSCVGSLASGLPRGEARRKSEVSNTWLAEQGLVSVKAVWIKEQGYSTQRLRRACQLVEPTSAEPRGGCCGGWGLDTPGYPIGRHPHAIQKMKRSAGHVHHSPNASFEEKPCITMSIGSSPNPRANSSALSSASSQLPPSRAIAQTFWFRYRSKSPSKAHADVIFTLTGSIAQAKRLPYNS